MFGPFQNRKRMMMLRPISFCTYVSLWSFGEETPGNGVPIVTRAAQWIPITDEETIAKSIPMLAIYQVTADVSLFSMLKVQKAVLFPICTCFVYLICVYILS
jgi:hypothetical protein